MKKLTKFFLLGTVVLAAAACQRVSEDELANPNYNPETNEVVTNFVFNVAGQAQTKQNADAVQAGSSNGFRGLVDAKLLTYAIADANHKGILPADATADKGFDLAQLATSTQISSSENRRVIELSLPLNTNTLLFYGRAPIGNTYDSYANAYDCYGHMDSYSVDKESGSASFKAGRRLSDEEYTKFLHVENMCAGIQTTLLYHKVNEGVTVSKTATPEGVATAYTFDATFPEGGIRWEQYATANGRSPYDSSIDRFPLENKLGNLYTQLTTIQATELRAGSGEAIMKMASDLLSVLNEVRCAIPLNPAEAAAKYFADQVYNRMVKYFNFTDNVVGGPITVTSFKSQEKLVEAFLSNEEKAFRPNIPSSIADAPEIYWPSASQLAAISDPKYAPKDFPFNFNLPRGAAYIAFDPTAHIFYYPQQFNVSAMDGLPGAGATYNGKSYYYPAELLYFGNSPIRTSSADLQTSDYPKGSGTAATQWCNDGSWAAGTWTGNKVATSTRAVAMKYNINYGVAVMETKVKFKGENGVIYDNNHNVQVEIYGNAAQDEEDNAIEIEDDMFVLTGIIIGGQSEAIGWDHLPVKVGDAYKYGFIYDKAIPGDGIGVPASGSSDSNYTLVYDNFHAASQTDGIYEPEAHQDKVSVALEFRNDTGKDIYGNHNLIRKGGYFYLIGLLDPEAANLAEITWPNESVNTTHIVPPYTAAGKSQKVSRIFIQDYKTTATFTIGKNSLHYAYLTVPDLRSASMTLGLSVDLKWETGLNFEEVLLGGN